MINTNDSQRAFSAVVTGAGSGSGREIALGLAERGFYRIRNSLLAAEVSELCGWAKGRE